jgi:hypothetical protein
MLNESTYAIFFSLTKFISAFLSSGGNSYNNSFSSAALYTLAISS